MHAFFVNDAHTFGRYAQPYEALLCLNPEAVVLQIGQKAPTSFIVCVRNVVA